MTLSARSTHLLKYCDHVTVVRVTVLEGAGSEGDPARDVIYWYDDDGIQIARRDTWEEYQLLAEEDRRITAEMRGTA